MSILDKIVRDTLELVADRKRVTPAEELCDRAFFHAPARSLAAALNGGSQGDDLAIIAEIKRASPSKGLIRGDFDPVTIAQSYTEHGAQAISVLTEPLHFQGALQFLSDVRPTTSLPLLRKDFILDPYQLVEAKAYGADAVLLIAACLEAQQLADLHAEAASLGLECLVEVYASEEVGKLNMDQVQILGVNNRDLHTFNVDLDHSITTFRQFPDDVIRISESGIASGDDLAYLKANGADGVLIGETFMRADDPGLALRAMREAQHAAASAR